MRKRKPPFRVALKFDLGGLGVSGHQTFERRAETRAAARKMIFGVRTGAYRRGSWVIPGSRLLYARIHDERRHGA